MAHPSFEHTSIGDSENMKFSQGNAVKNCVQDDTTNTLHAHDLQHANYESMMGHKQSGKLMSHHPNQHHPDHPNHRSGHGMHSGKSHHSQEHKAADRIHSKKK